MTFGGRIREARKKRGMSQEELAAKVGVTKSSVSQWENDISKIDGVRLIALCKVLNLSPEYVVSGKTPPSLTPEEQELIEIWRHLNEHERHHAIELLRIIENSHTPPPLPPYKKPG